MLMQFLRDRRAAVLPMFAIAAIPMIVATGAVIDYARAYQQRTIVQDALDSAALASGKQIGLISDDLVKAEAANFYNTNVGTRLDIKPALVPAISASTITLTTQLHVPTYFLGLIGLNEFVFDLKAQATSAAGTLEVAMVLDNSTSMNQPSTKISTLRTAAGDLATTLWGLGATSTKVDPVKIAIIPFGATVNVGSSATWVDKLGKGDRTAMKDSTLLGAGNTAPGTFYPYQVFSSLKDSSGNDVTWAGCVETRPAPYDVSDDPPSTAVTPSTEEAKTLFEPMVAPDEPDNWTCGTGSCDYLGSSNSTRRYNGAPTGTQTYNNYLPDVPSNTFTVTKAAPGVFTSTAHGLTAGTKIGLLTTGSMYTPLAEGTDYYVAAYGLTANAFTLTTMSAASTVTIAAATTNTFTVTRASPAVFTKNGHGLTAGTAIILTTTGAMYTPLTNGSTYYVISSGLSTNSFRVSTTSGGSAVNTSGSQSGTHSYYLAAPTVFTKSSHGLAVGDVIVFSTTGTLPSPLVANTAYFVKTVPTTGTFTIAATSGGAGIVAVGSQSGTHSFIKLITTTGSQSGTHSYTFPDKWTCQSGTAGCGGTGIGESEQRAFAGLNVTGSPEAKYGTASKKATASNVTVANLTGTGKGGPNFMCTTPAITPLTTDQTTVSSAIGVMVPNGYTNITEGVAWGWRVLSPGVPFTDGRPYSTTDNQKVMVLMTDGENTYMPYLDKFQTPGSYAGKFVKSGYGAWNYLGVNNLGTPTFQSTDVFVTLNQRTAAACAAAKAAGIIIYAVGFEINDQTSSDPAAALALLQGCASGTSRYYDAQDESSLLTAFSAIGDDISQLRLSQ